MSRKDKKIILIAQCLVNPYCRVHIPGKNFPLSDELMSFLLERKVGVVQYSLSRDHGHGIDTPSPNDPVLRGIMAEIWEEALGNEGITVPFLEFPVKSPPDSPPRQKFWAELHKTIEPFAVLNALDNRLPRISVAVEHENSDTPES